MASRDLKLRLLLEDKASGQFKKVDAKLEGTGQKFAKFATAAKLALTAGAGKAVLDFVVDMDRLATTGESVQRRFDTVFGEMADTVAEWVDEQNEAFGMSETQLKSLAGNVQDLLVPIGFTRDAAADMTETILTTANALSEWKDGAVTVESAVDRIQKALLGEREGMKELGVKISEADVKAQLLKDGTDKLTGAAGEQAKAQATLEIILGKSADALGAYADAGDTAIRKNKEIKATSEELRQVFADLLKPAIDEAKDSLSDFAVIAQALIDLQKDNGDAAEEAASGFDTLLSKITSGPVLGGVQQFRQSMSFIADLLRGQEEDAGIAGEAVRNLADNWANDVIPTGGILVGTLEDITADTDEMADTIGNAYEKFDFLGEHVQSVGQRLEEFQTTVDETAQGVVNAFDPLPDQIETSLDELGDNMADWLVTMNEWRAGLRTLAAWGMSDLANVFLEQGPASLDVLNEALSDPSKAAALNHTAEELAFGFGGSFIDSLAAFLEMNLEATLRDAAQQASVFVDVPTFTSSNSPAARRANVRNIDRQLAEYHRERQ